MGEEPKIHSWWQTLPGILTATAGIITAVTGLLVVLYNAGFFESAGKNDNAGNNDNPTYTASPIADPGDEASKSRETSTAAVAAGQETGTPDTPEKEPAASTADQAMRINLFDPDNGVQLLVASNDYWAATIDGKEDLAQVNYGLGKEAVYGFKEERAATFDTFTMLIGETSDSNVKEFELLAGNDSPTGTFESIGKFTPQNVKLFKTPYQAFTFPPVTAKYLKIKLLSTHSGVSQPDVWEYQLFGSLK